MFRVISESLALGLLSSGALLLGCGQKADPAEVAAVCRSMMEEPFWRSWEARMNADPNWAKLSAEEQQKFRAEAAADWEKELASAEGQEVLANCTATYGRLSPTQLKCVKIVNPEHKEAIAECLKM